MAHETLVIDASVVVKWYCDEEDTDIALKIKERFFENKCKLTAPNLLIYEVANTVRFVKMFSAEERIGILDDLYSIGFEFIYPDEKMMASALSMAVKYETTVYDAVYFALAREKGCAYVTADDTFVRNVKEEGVVSLGDYKA
jgi:predicted nucleic acid-binding protein